MGGEGGGGSSISQLLFVFQTVSNFDEKPLYNYGDICLFVVAVKRITRVFHRQGARCSSVVRAFAQGAISRRIDPLWWTH